MDIDKTIDTMLGLGVGFLLLGYLVVPQLVNVLASVANLTDETTKSFLTAAITIVMFVALIYWLKSGYSGK